MKRTWRALVGIGVAAVMVGAPLLAAPAIAADRAVVVCKYVTTPGENERLQVVIEPNEASLGEGFTGTFPYAFADAHIRSLAIGYADEGLDISDCPPPQEEPEQPPDEPLSETRENSFCTSPLNGTRTTVVEQRTGTRTYVWDGDSWEPQDTWGAWMATSTTTAPDPACVATPRDVDPDPPVVVNVPPTTSVPPATSVPPTTTLAVTGAEDVPPLLPFIAAAMLLMGIAASAYGAIRRRA